MKGAICSLNNVFTDIDKFKFSAWQKFTQYEFGTGLPGKLATKLKGLPFHDALQLILAQFNTKLDEENYHEFLTQWQNDYTSTLNQLDENDQQHGIKRLLLNLYDHYVTIAVLDFNGNAGLVLKRLALDNYVDLIVSANNDNPYATAISKMALNSSDCIGIGTTAKQIMDMHNARIVAIGVGNESAVANADYQVVQVGDLRYPMLQKTWENIHLRN